MKHYRVKTSGKWLPIAKLFVPIESSELTADRELRKKVRKLLEEFLGKNVEEAFFLTSDKGVFSMETTDMLYDLTYDYSNNVYVLTEFNEELELVEVDEIEFHNTVTQYIKFD